ncbi:toxin-activating lysine-acyltransferase RzcC [Rhizobium sp. ACO-34A]|nr:toxin-activating lysine-acyltransferase [Rhizobium sp. ACO-34A]ATN32504.1 toxin-activating lysine-acyltransferase RzcC [Rhizobium sp. ACO-34A]
MAKASRTDEQVNTGAEAADADVLSKLVEVKGQVYSIFGQAVLALSAVPRYRSQSLADLAHLVMEPLVNDRIAIASAKNNENTKLAALAPSAVAIWASVSAEVDAKIVEQVKAGVFPVRLKPTEWNSGDTVWLLDVIAPTKELATSVLSNFNKVAKQDQIKVHPIVGRQVDAEILKKLTNKPDTSDSKIESEAALIVN